jgi:aspartate/methionine/tyrosine aminotransferase
VLAHIALQAEARIIGRNRTIAQANQQRLQAFLRRHPDLFQPHAPSDASLAFPRYLGADGADRFAARLVREAGVLLLPSGLWRSPLADLPTDRLRIGLGRAEVPQALAALDTHLARSRQPAAVA